MKRNISAVTLLILALRASAVETNTTAVIRLDRVNLRAAPDMRAEVVAQAAAGDVLAVVRREGPWCAVLPPTNASFYVFGAYVQEGVVTASTLQVRSGPGINFRPTGVLRRGETVAPRGRHGPWLCIAPPAGALLWVRGEFLEIVHPAASDSEGTDAQGSGHAAGATSVPAAETQNAPAPTPIAPAARPLSPDFAVWLEKNALAPPVQVSRMGTVLPLDFLFRKPAQYRLVHSTPGSPAATLAYLRNGEESFGTWVGLTVRVHGREYRLRGYRYPLLVPDRIERLP